jgi:hypothetical protein
LLESLKVMRAKLSYTFALLLEITPKGANEAPQV